MYDVARPCFLRLPSIHTLLHYHILYTSIWTEWNKGLASTVWNAVIRTTLIYHSWEVLQHRLLPSTNQLTYNQDLAVYHQKTDEQGDNDIIQFVLVVCTIAQLVTSVKKNWGTGGLFLWLPEVLGSQVNEKWSDGYQYDHLCPQHNMPPTDSGFSSRCPSTHECAPQQTDKYQMILNAI